MELPEAHYEAGGVYRQTPHILHFPKIMYLVIYQ